MNPSFVKNLTEAFLGRICTVMPSPVANPIKDAAAGVQYFTGEVVAIDHDGVWIKHPMLKTMSFFAFPLVGIVEENMVRENDPLFEQADKEWKERIKKETEKKQPPKVQSPCGSGSAPKSSFVNIEELTAKINKAQKKN